MNEEAEAYKQVALVNDLRYTKLVRAAKLAQEALLKCEWLWDEGLLMNYCPFCNSVDYLGGHRDNCPRQAALRTLAEALE